jgi:hypothetical protein
MQQRKTQNEKFPNPLLLIENAATHAANAFYTNLDLMRATHRANAS